MTAENTETTMLQNTGKKTQNRRAKMTTSLPEEEQTLNLANMILFYPVL